MSTDTGFSNTDINKQTADPYKEANKDEVDVSLKTKVEDLLNFITDLKYGMMTTRQTGTGCLVSRCMALAAKVSEGCF